MSLVVVSPIDVSTFDDTKDGSPAPAKLSDSQQLLDQADDFNHPRIRRLLILQQLLLQQKAMQTQGDGGGSSSDHHIQFEVATALEEEQEDWTRVYAAVHTRGLLNFLTTAWERWQISGQDPSGGLETTSGFLLVPSCQPLPRDPTQRPSSHVIGQMGYYCTEVCTPVFAALIQELQGDAAILQRSVEVAIGGGTTTSQSPPVAVYALCTHPGHHAAADSFGGYCYVNHAAATARMLQSKLKKDSVSSNDDHDTPRIAILDVDYHAGNGTASIFYNDPSVLVVSLHCDPNAEYPFHSGFADQIGTGKGTGTTLHLPMPPGTTWESAYRENLQNGLDAIRQFVPSAVCVSLGLDTYDQDPCAIRRAGFHLKDDDYKAMGRLMAKELPPLKCPTIFLQEGGYRMDKIAKAAADVVTSFCEMREKN